MYIIFIYLLRSNIFANMQFSVILSLAYNFLLHYFIISVTTGIV
jgi:hypothetical protein